MIVSGLRTLIFVILLLSLHSESEADVIDQLPDFEILISTPHLVVHVGDSIPVTISEFVIADQFRLRMSAPLAPEVYRLYGVGVPNPEPLGLMLQMSTQILSCVKVGYEQSFSIDLNKRYKIVDPGYYVFAVYRYDMGIEFVSNKLVLRVLN